MELAFLISLWLPLFAAHNPIRECEKEGTPAQISANITCDQQLRVFVDGRQVGNTSTGYQNVGRLTIPRGSSVIGLQCKGQAMSNLSATITGGILGSLSNGLLTNSHWKCSHRYQEDWASLDFDDSSWANAVSRGVNNHRIPNLPFPWGHTPDVWDGAHWIWGNDTTSVYVYCRHRLINKTECVPVRMSGFFDSSEFLLDKSLPGTLLKKTSAVSPVDCGLLCHQHARCKSFNFEYASSATAKACELNSGAAGSGYKGLAERNGFVYYDIFHLEENK